MIPAYLGLASIVFLSLEFLVRFVGLQRANNLYKSRHEANHNQPQMDEGSPSLWNIRRRVSLVVNHTGRSVFVLGCLQTASCVGLLVVSLSSLVFKPVHKVNPPKSQVVLASLETSSGANSWLDVVQTIYYVSALFSRVHITTHSNIPSRCVFLY